MYLAAALVRILVTFIAGLFLSAELEQQALQKDVTAQHIARQQEIAPQVQHSWTPWRRHAD